MYSLSRRLLAAAHQPLWSRLTTRPLLTQAHMHFQLRLRYMHKWAQTINRHIRTCVWKGQPLAIPSFFLIIFFLKPDPSRLRRPPDPHAKANRLQECDFFFTKRCIWMILAMFEAMDHHCNQLEKRTCFPVTQCAFGPWSQRCTCNSCIDSIFVNKTAQQIDLSVYMCYCCRPTCLLGSLSRASLRALFSDTATQDV